MTNEDHGSIKRPIMAAIDFSEASKEVLRFAAELAEQNQAPLLIFHAAHEPAGEPGYYARRLGASYPIALDLAAKILLKSLVEEMQAQHPELMQLKMARTLVIDGLPAQRIPEVARIEDAALVVLGSHGRTGLDHLVLGSVAEQVTRRSDRPVTVVKGPWAGWTRPQPIAHEPLQLASMAG